MAARFGRSPRDRPILAPVRAPKRHRPRRRSVAAAPAGIDLADVAAHASYVGSPEHKTYPSFAGLPRLRADATRCDPAMADRETLTRWLRAAIAAGSIGEPWEGRFPRYVW